MQRLRAAGLILPPQMPRLINILALALIICASLIAPAYATTQFELSVPAVSKGKTFTVLVSLTPDREVSGISVTVKFDSSKAQLSSIDTSKSAFPITLASRTEPGRIHLERGIVGKTISGPGSVPIASITFTALSDTQPTFQLTETAIASGGTVIAVEPSAQASPSTTPDSSKNSPDSSASAATQTQKTVPTQNQVQPTDTNSPSQTKPAAAHLIQRATQHTPGLIVAVLAGTGIAFALWRRSASVRKR